MNQGEPSYLDDPTAAVDPEIERLERLLAPLAYRPRTFGAARPVSRGWPRLAATAAGLLAVAGGATLLALREPAPRPAGLVAAVAPPSDWRIDTRGAAGAMLSLVGLRIHVRPESLVAVTPSGIVLQQGWLDAEALASDSRVRVGTPVAVAFSPGARYSLRYEPRSGAATIDVERGYVVWEGAARTVVVPEQASCVARRTFGPGTPFWRAATRTLRGALERFDEGGALGPALEQAGATDTITLWHLLTDPREPVRRQSRARLIQLYPGAEPDGRRAWLRALKLEPLSQALLR